MLWRPLDGVAAPEKLASLNYVRFDEHRSFMVGLKRLVAALTVDLDWLREHTRILSRAREWEESGRSANRLLVGEALAEANGWAERRPKDAPPTSPVLLDFLNASDVGEAARNSTERQRLEERELLVTTAERTQRRASYMLWAIGALVVMLFGGSLWQALQTAKREVLVFRL